MQKEMIHCLLAFHAHATFVYHNNVSLLKIFQSQNFTQHRRPNEKDRSQRSLRPPHTLPREAPRLIDELIGLN